MNVAIDALEGAVRSGARLLRAMTGRSASRTRMSLARYEPADAGVPDEAGSARFSAIGVARFCADALRSVRLEEVDVEARRHESLDGLEQHHETHRRPDVKVNRIAALLQVCCPSHRVLAGQMLDQADPLVVMPPARPFSAR